MMIIIEPKTTTEKVLLSPLLLHPSKSKNPVCSPKFKPLFAFPLRTSLHPSKSFSDFPSHDPSALKQDLRDRKINGYSSAGSPPVIVRAEPIINLSPRAATVVFLAQPVGGIGARLLAHRSHEPIWVIHVLRQPVGRGKGPRTEYLLVDFRIVGLSSGVQIVFGSLIVLLAVSVLDVFPWCHDRSHQHYWDQAIRFSLGDWGCGISGLWSESFQAGPCC